MNLYPSYDLIQGEKGYEVQKYAENEILLLNCHHELKNKMENPLGKTTTQFWSCVRVFVLCV